ncbi:hypothetical protein MJ390_08790 [Klebsiella pneumoniae]|nr:hypothetical protein MJ390_08790 [Klebsiella pneumoniae]
MKNGAPSAWRVSDSNGNDMAEVVSATLERLQPNGKPHVVIANTTKGAGISFIPGTPRMASPGTERSKEIELALEELKDE